MKTSAADMDGWILELARQGSLSGVVAHIKVRVRVQFVDHRSDLVNIRRQLPEEG